ncbi:MAG: UDP-N-acetylmuramoyl-tripeptide--D-alanyl-D-alanine ligase, partial [Defluviitaleaceae bacterium]|nr:UDP-N-acetylmuramoyl-tripeptide--D-alanyl-D-alanine ligase [Defluviitaleaceae bacterium]
SMLRADEDAKFVVLEMGMNHFGEISVLSKAAVPDVAVITNIGDSHIENLGSREGILNAKLEIAEGMDNGTLVLNGDDPHLSRARTGLKTVYCKTAGIDSEIVARRIKSLGPEGTVFDLNIRGVEREARIGLPGTHMVTNALLAAGACDSVGMGIDDIVSGIGGFVPKSPGRMEILKANGMTVINDAYNANPQSMAAALSVLACFDEKSGNRVAILGDMLELGERSEEFHKNLGAAAACGKVDKLVAIGRMAKSVLDGFIKASGDIGKALYFEDKEIFLAERENILNKGDIVLVKASHSMAFQKIVDALIN